MDAKYNIWNFKIITGCKGRSLRHITSENGYKQKKVKREAKAIEK